VVLLLAFLIPVSWLAYKQLGNPAAPLVYGAQLSKITELEARIAADPKEREVAAIFARRAREYEARLQDVEGALQRERAAAQESIRQLKAQGADSAQLVQAHRALAALPKTPAAAREQWTRAMHESQERARAPWRRPAALPAFRRRPGRHAAGARGLLHDAPQLPGTDVLPDGGHRGPAAPAHRATTPRPASPRRARRWPGRWCSSRWSTSARRRWPRWSSSR
jgi:hypothetical protein